MWEKSGGFASKFGLDHAAVARALGEADRQLGCGRNLALLHFHIGSQITEIRKIKTAVREAARIYAKVRKTRRRGLVPRRRRGPRHRLRRLEDLVRRVGQLLGSGVRERRRLRHSGSLRRRATSRRRGSSASPGADAGGVSRACSITDVRAAVSGQESDPRRSPGVRPRSCRTWPTPRKKISVKNYREFYHDAIEYRDQMYSLFNLGMLGLEERGQGRGVLPRRRDEGGAVLEVGASSSRTSSRRLETKLHDKYICNFSVFQSVPDHWALDQALPDHPRAPPERDPRPAKATLGRHHVRFRRRGRETCRPEGHQGRPRGPRA